MSFNELPNVDRSSQNEDESNSYFRLLFSEKNGFLTSKPEKDKGCDFLVELIMEGGATNWRFPVQLKSIENPKFIENGRLISYSFEVSRLYYMKAHIPPVGLIIFYWPKNNMLYYDYAECIYNRLLEMRKGNMAWQQQEHVSIHIPANNVVNNDDLATIHHHILSRYQNLKDRSEPLYLPLETPISQSAEASIPEAITDTVELLKQRGLIMFYNHEIPALGELVNQVQLETLRADARLSFLAGITNWAMGNAADASFWLGKALNNRDISANDRDHAIWKKLYLDMYLGKISLLDYNVQLKEQLALLVSDDQEQRLHYELSIARNEIEMHESKDLVTLLKAYNDCKGISARITNSKLNETAKIGYHLLNTTNLALVLFKVDLLLRRRIADRITAGMQEDSKLNEDIKAFITELANRIEYSFACLKTFAQQYAHPVQLAQCYETQISIWLELTLSALLPPARKLAFNSPVHISNITRCTTLAKDALGILLANHRYLSAYNVSLMLLELCEFATHSGLQLDIDKKALSEQVDKLQQQLDLAPPKLHAKALIEQYKNDKYAGG